MTVQPAKAAHLMGLGDVAPPATSLRVLGIDLGTTNSTVTEMVLPAGGSQPTVEVIQVRQPTPIGPHLSHLVPSMVYVSPEGQVMVGEGARRIPLIGRPYAANVSLFRDTKNDMGTDETYSDAPEGFRRPQQIATQVLAYLREVANAPHGGDDADHIVITVPASFFATQRDDTLKAAIDAGFPLDRVSLLDEPIAAFLHAMAAGDVDVPAGRTRCAVFDFGGGTCDIALLTLAHLDGERGFGLQAVSRYTRLGGSDIDRAIAHHVLVPQVAEALGVDVDELDSDVRDDLMDQLASVADDLKQKLVGTIDRRVRLGKDASDVRVEIPRKETVRAGDRNVSIKPALTGNDFDRLLQPFVDQQHLHAMQGEFFDSQSIFAPLTDVIERAGWSVPSLDLVLAVGGSSFLPQVQSALRTFFGEKTIIEVPSPGQEFAQSEISQGAALQAMATALTDRPLIAPAAPERIDLMVDGTPTGAITLVPADAPLPWPEDRPWTELSGLVLPDLDRGVRLEIRRGSVVLGVEVIEPRPSWRAGMPAILEYQYDENQLLKVFIVVDGDRVAMNVDRPWSFAQRTTSPRLEVRKLRRQERDEVDPAKREKLRYQLAEAYRELRQYTRARDTLRAVLRDADTAWRQAGALNALGTNAGDRMDDATAVSSYTQSADLLDWDPPLFNLALHYRRRGDLTSALRVTERALGVERSPANLALHALLSKDAGKPGADRALRMAADEFGDPDDIDSAFLLAWYRMVADGLRDKNLQRRIIERRRVVDAPAAASGKLLIARPT